MTSPSPIALRAAIVAACANGGLSEASLSKLTTYAGASAVPLILMAMDLVHAERATASEAWLEIGRACAARVAAHDWFRRGAFAAGLTFDL